VARWRKEILPSHSLLIAPERARWVEHSLRSSYKVIEEKAIEEKQIHDKTQALLTERSNNNVEFKRNQGPTVLHPPNTGGSMVSTPRPSHRQLTMRPLIRNQHHRSTCVFLYHSVTDGLNTDEGVDQTAEHLPFDQPGGSSWGEK
jgi:hypothetical protein